MSEIATGWQCLEGRVHEEAQATTETVADAMAVSKTVETADETRHVSTKRLRAEGIGCQTTRVEVGEPK